MVRIEGHGSSIFQSQIWHIGYRHTLSLMAVERRRHTASLIQKFLGVKPCLSLPLTNAKFQYPTSNRMCGTKSSCRRDITRRGFRVDYRCLGLFWIISTPDFIITSSVAVGSTSSAPRLPVFTSNDCLLRFPVYRLSLCYTRQP